MNALAGRIAPASNDEKAAAIHEAGHAVFCQILHGMNGFGRVTIWKSEWNWTGFCGPNNVREVRPYDENNTEGLPPIDATMPYYWQKHVRDGWSMLLCAFAGSGAESVLERTSLDADSIRWHREGNAA